MSASITVESIRAAARQACLALGLGDHHPCDLLNDDRSKATRELANRRFVGHALIDRDQKKRRRCENLAFPTGRDDTLHATRPSGGAMPRAGRNEPCPCGSGRKVKRCCGQQRGPSEDDLARANIAILAREAAPDIADLSDDDLADLWEQLLDLPALDISLLVELPKLITPDLQRLQEAIADDDPDSGWDALTALATQIDTPRQRARLAHALITLRNDHRIDREQAAAAIIDLDSRSTHFIAASLLEAVALSAGVTHTPSGLQIAANIAA